MWHRNWAAILCGHWGPLYAVELKDLIGIWKPDLPQEGYSMVLKFSGDGNYRMAWSVEKLDTRPVDRAQVRFEGQQVTFVSSESPTCKNYIGKYNIKMTEKVTFN